MQNNITDLQNFIRLSKQSRWNKAENRKETWEESVDRYCNNVLYSMDSRLEQTSKSIKDMDTVPSMRALYSAGHSLEKNNISAYNCAFSDMDSLVSIAEVLFVLMHGTGFGFSVEHRAISKLPEVPSEIDPSIDVITIEDSKEGWFKGYNEYLVKLFGGNMPMVDFSNIRKKGAELKTFGGQASGPEPLMKLFDYTRNLVFSRQGQNLRSIDVHDLICNIADIVVVGGVRRSALISLFDMDDKDMLQAKQGEWWVHHPYRANANNSFVYDGRDLSNWEFVDLFREIYKSGSGEPGMFNRHAARRKVRSIGRSDYGNFGTNPCVSYETPILTKEYGNIPIGDILGEEVHVWNGDFWAVVTPSMTGHSMLYKAEFTDGTSLVCTKYHRFVTPDNEFVELQDMELGDPLAKFKMPILGGIETDKHYSTAYSQGFYQADGNTGLNYSWVYEPKYVCMGRLIGEVDEGAVSGRKIWRHGPMKAKDYVPHTECLDYKISWLAGLLDGDGTVCYHPNASSFQLCSIDRNFLLDMRLMLTTMGVNAKVTKSHDAAFKELPDGKGGKKDYFCQSSYRLLINSTDVDHLMLNLKMKLERLEPKIGATRDASRFARLESVTELHEAPTYCFKEPLTGRGTFNGIVTGQCGEIILRSKQVCNLSEVVAVDDKEEMRNRVDIAARVGTHQSLLTHFPNLSEEWVKNTEEERLLGVSITGVYDVNGEEWSDEYLEELNQVAEKANKEEAEKLGIPASAAITCIKPSGTVSQLVGCSSGLHPRHAKSYIRRVRLSPIEPMCQFLKDQGMSSVEDRGQEVFSFVVHSPDGATTRKDVSAKDHFQTYLKFTKHWCDHNASITISMKEEEWVPMAQMVYDNLDDVIGVSFLPYSDHVYANAPFESLVESDSIDWKKLSEYETITDVKSGQELACVGGSCEINL